MKRFHFLFMIALTSTTFFACKNEPSKTPEQAESPKDTTNTDSIADTDFSMYLNDTALVFYPGMMHGEEVPKNAETLNWMALVLEKDSSFSIKKVQLKKEIEHDPIVDGEDESVKTGLSFSCDSSLHALYFFSIPLPEQNHFKGHFLPSSSFFPGSNYSVQQNGKTFKISATGEGLNNEGQPTEKSEEIRGYKNYRIVFEGPGIQQELLSKKEDYESTPQPLFIGDLNMDGIPDLIMDTESHYNITGLALFLSEKGKLRLVAYHLTSGC
jgi:hypothetical protein